MDSREDVLEEKINAIGRDIKYIRKDINDLYEKIEKMNYSFARLTGKLEGIDEFRGRLFRRMNMRIGLAGLIVAILSMVFSYIIVRLV